MDEDSAAGPRPPLGVRAVPPGWVTVKASVKAPEAAVLESLLDSGGIRAVIAAMDPDARPVLGYASMDRWLRVCVAPEDADDATALIEGSLA